MKKIAHCIHHTHWDLIWYFSVQDATAQFSYNMKELIKGFQEKEIEDFFMDGQTAPIDEYLQLHPEDETILKELIGDKKLVIGPFQSQLDCFISSGESVLNNLRLGMKSARKLGHVSRVAYLPDSFGHSYDFPKIFNKFGIHDFVITRGVGDNYNLDSEFYMRSNDGSELLVCTMIAGYGYGCYAFKEGNLFQQSALDYNKISVQSLIDRVLKYSTIEHEFVFPLGFDQNPALLNIREKIHSYNAQQQEIEFQSTTWEQYAKHVRKHGNNLKVHEDELFSTQYHRLHKSIFSARADIKAIQDACERLLTYELQPLMSMLDSLGIPYDQGLIDKAWDTLLKCQTHSSATLTDETNDYIERESKNALHLANSTKVYLLKLMSISLGHNDIKASPLIVCNTLPTRRKMIVEMKILSKTPTFHIYDGEERLSFTILHSQKKNCGVLRKDIQLLDEHKFYYEVDIVLETTMFDGISYKVYQITEDKTGVAVASHYDKFIENKRYKLYQNERGIVIFDKLLNHTMEQAIYLEDMGDEGDSFDYSYPTYDMKLCEYMEDATLSCTCTSEIQRMHIQGTMMIPSNLKMRKHQQCDDNLPYAIDICLKKDSDRIEIKGSIKNTAEQHRVRFIVTGTHENTHSYAGTQYGYIKRQTNPGELQTWRDDQWFEEPSPTFPLLNHVSMVNDNCTTTVLTRSSKEYELVEGGYKNLAITLFRSYGAMAYPDLNRRPGRPSGLDYMIFETPKCQMKQENTFELALRYASNFDANEITNSYIDYACNALYYQKQDFDKSLNPIAYFPTNVLKQALPNAYSFLMLEGCQGNFGSVVKSEVTNSYVLRLYNSEQHEVACGKIKGDRTWNSLSITDMEELNSTPVSETLPPLQKGDLRILKIDKSL